MTDPTGTQGLDRKTNDLDIAFGGGADFMARLKALLEAKDAADLSLSQLNLGNDVMAALGAAQLQKQQATELREQAAKVLANASKDAATAIATANDQAKALVADAQAKATATRDAAQAIKTAAETDTAAQRKEIDRLRREAEAEKTTAQTARVATEKLAGDHKAAYVAMQETTRQAAESRAKLDAKIAALKGILADLQQV